MRRSLGRLIAVLILGANVWGSTYTWRLLEAPQSLYLGQSGMVRYECAFSDSAAEYTIAFKPENTPAYDVRILTQQDKIAQGKRIQSFDVQITPKHQGIMEINLDALIRHTTFASIENATIGRDNVKKYDFDDEKVFLPKASIDVKANSAALTGNITMEAHIDQNTVHAHEPAHLSVIIKGSGNLEQFVPYQLNISGVRVFSEPPKQLFSPSADGVEGEIRQEFALVADKSYVIPPFTLSVFDTVHNRPVILKSEALNVEVKEGYDPVSLLDVPDLSDRSTLKRYAYNLGWIVLGIFLGEISRRLWRIRPQRKNKEFWESAKTPKELVMVLALSGDKRFESIIAELEAGSILLGEAKKKLGRLSTDKKVTL
jgi:hypothetical protein